MKIEDYKELYKTIDFKLTNFKSYYSNIENSSDKKIKERLENNIYEIIKETEEEIFQSEEEIFILFSNINKVNDLSKSVILEDFRKPKNFIKSISHFLKKIESKITELEKI